MDSILKEGKSVSFYAKGISMTPFIKDGDKLILKPLSEIRPSIGRVVAFINRNDGKFFVHRIIAENPASYLIKADYSSKNTDGWIEKSQIMGCVSGIMRNGSNISFGLGWERIIIAYISKKGLLTKIVYYFNRLLKAK